MKRLYIKGLVRIANRTRIALAGPMSQKQLADLRAHAASTVRTVENLVLQHGLKVEQLPLPSRNAYRYMAGINWDAVRPQACAERPKRGLIRFNGLSSFFDRLLSQLGGAGPRASAEETYASIIRTAQRLADNLTKDPIEQVELTAESRGILEWLNYFGHKDNFDQLVDAIVNARAELTAEIEQTQCLELPVVVHFRPMKGLYRVRRFHDATLVQLPTPMICFDSEDFAALAMAICGDNGSRQPVLERTATEAYRALQAELDGPAHAEHSEGAFHDLGAAFRRVAERYFAGAVAKPRLVWSHRITSCKFGHYDPVRDELMVSATLDSREVPSHVLDFVVYHELLHKKHGATWQNGRQAVHTPAFRQEERRFAEYTAAEKVIKELSRRFGSRS